MPIKVILFLFAYWIIFLSSAVSPELLISIRISFWVILPRSPWEQSLADNAKLGAPTEDKEAAICDATWPLFPTPINIVFEVHFPIALTAWLNEFPIKLFNFRKANIWSSIVLWADFL